MVAVSEGREEQRKEPVYRFTEFRDILEQHLPEIRLSDNF
jgi:hypothetical protein